VVPLVKFGDTPGVVAPLGTEVKATLCIAVVSWSVQVIVVPGATLMLDGLKLDPVPAPCGIVIALPPEAPDAEELALLVTVLFED